MLVGKFSALAGPDKALLKQPRPDSASAWTPNKTSISFHKTDCFSKPLDPTGPRKVFAIYFQHRFSIRAEAETEQRQSGRGIANAIDDVGKECTTSY